MNIQDAGMALIVIAVGLGLGAGILIWRCCPLRVIGTPATGTVERVIKRTVMVQDVPRAVPHPETVRDLVIVFTTRTGDVIRFQTGAHGSGARAPGDSVPIRYRATHPTEAEVEGASAPFRAALVLIGLSAVLGVAAAIVLS